MKYNLSDKDRENIMVLKEVTKFFAGIIQNPMFMFENERNHELITDIHNLITNYQKGK